MQSKQYNYTFSSPNFRQQSTMILIICNCALSFFPFSQLVHVTFMNVYKSYVQLGLKALKKGGVLILFTIPMRSLIKSNQLYSSHHHQPKSYNILLHLKYKAYIQFCNWKNDLPINISLSTSTTAPLDLCTLYHQ